MSKNFIDKLPKHISSTLNSVNKTLSENQNLKVNINSNIILEKEETLNLPTLSTLFNFDDMRGASDSFALKKNITAKNFLTKLLFIILTLGKKLFFLKK